jgi:small nuclear ribonucleoprotein B and B'
MSTRQSKFLIWINYRIRVTLSENRVLIGTFLAFDKHMNLVLSDTEEHCLVKSKNKKFIREKRRTLGLVLIRGDSVIAISAESQEPNNNKKRFDNVIGKDNEFNNNNNTISGLGSVGRGVGIPNMNSNFNAGRGFVVPPNIQPPSIPPPK